MLGHLLRLAMLLICLEVVLVLRLGLPEANELIIQPASGVGVRPLGGLGPIEGSSLSQRRVHENLALQHLGLGEHHRAPRPAALPARLRLSEPFQAP